MGFWRDNTGPPAVVATVGHDVPVRLTEGSVNIGDTRPAVAQQFAEILGIVVEGVNSQVADTGSIGYTSNTGESGVAFKANGAAYEAA